LALPPFLTSRNMSRNTLPIVRDVPRYVPHVGAAVRQVSLNSVTRLVSAYAGFRPILTWVAFSPVTRSTGA
jgi:hypothetical protein